MVEEGVRDERKNGYQLKHAGQKFGCPPLFDFALVLLYLCILHTLLRLIAVVFKRTIVANQYIYASAPTYCSPQPHTHPADMVRDTPVDISQLSQQYVEAALR